MKTSLLKKLTYSITAFALISGLTGCGDSQADKQPERLVEAPEYLEIKKEFLSNNRMTVSVLLREKVDKDALKSLALKVCQDTSCKSYDKTGVFVYLPGMNTDSKAWATAKFSPKLELIFSGIEAPNFNFDISNEEFKNQVVQYHKELVTIMGKKKKRECGFATLGECNVISTDARQWKASSEKFAFLHSSNPKIDLNLKAAFGELSMLALSLIQNDQKWVVIKTFQIQDDLARYEEAKREALKNPTKPNKESKPLSPEEFKKFLAKADKEDKLRKAKAMKREQALPNLGITVEEFEKVYNKFLSDYTADFGGSRLKPIKVSVTPGEKIDMMVACPSERSCIVAPVFKHTKKIQKIMVNGTTDGTKASAHDLLWNMIIACSAAAKNQSRYDAFDTVAEVAVGEISTWGRSGGYQVTYDPHPAFGLQITMTRDRR